MRLLTVTHYFGSHGGGIERVAEQLAAQLADVGHSVSWLATDASPPSSDSAIETHVLRANHWVERKLGVPFPIPAPSELRNISMAVRRADAVLIHDCLYLSNIAAFLIAKRARKPVLIVQHVGDVPYRNVVLRLTMKLANRLITKALLTRADQVVFISELTKSQFANVRFRREPVLAFNGVDSALFNPGPGKARPASRARLKLGPSDKLVVFAGRFVEKKGLHVVRALAEARPNLRFALAGDGPITPGAWGLPNVQVLGKLAAVELADLYRAGDLFLLPSTGEGFPLVIQEALACGLPVLCGADTAEADREASPFLTGVPVDASNPEATAAGFLAALDGHTGREDRPKDRALRSAFAIRRYSWVRLGQTYSRLLQAIAGAAQHVPRQERSLPAQV